VARIKYNIKQTKEKIIMDRLAAKIYITGKILELGKTLIYKTEILSKGKAGIEKFKEVHDGFWKKLEDLLEKEKSIDRPFIPNFVEEVGEEALTIALEEAKKNCDLRVVLQNIFNIEKKENPAAL
jgi:universal stress protein